MTLVEEIRVALNQFDDKTYELLDPLAKHLASLEIVQAAPRIRFFGMPLIGSGFGNALASKVVEIARRHDPDYAAAWLDKVCTTIEADIRFTLAVYGISTEEPIEFDNGVRLLPIDRLVDSPNARALQLALSNTPWGIMGPPPYPVAATTVEPDVKGEPMDERGDGPHKQVSLRCRERLLDVCRGLSLSDEMEPIAGESWNDFVDPELTHALFGRMTTGPAYEGSVTLAFAREVSAEHVAIANDFINLPAKMRSEYSIALDRLNLAKRRAKPGDKAIDGSICLEALLGDRGANQEMTHKIAIRAANLLADSKDEKLELISDVKAFYRLRSATVHGGRPNDKLSEANAIASKGLKICGRVARRLVRIGVPPDRQLLDLGYWPPNEIIDGC